MRKIIIAIIMVFILGTVCALDPKIISVTNEEAYVNNPTTFTVMIDDDGMTGNVQFIVDEIEISEKPFSEENNIIEFSQTWSVKETKKIRFNISLDPLIGETDSNMENNYYDLNIEVKRGIDLKIKEFKTIPTIVTPGKEIEFDITVENIGDKIHAGTIPVEVILNEVVICTKSISGIGIEQKNIKCTWISPETTSESYEFIAYVNRNGVAIPEETITNNSKSYITQIAPKAELYVKKIDVPENLKRGTVTNFSIIIGNKGGRPAENFNTNIYLAYENEIPKKVSQKMIEKINVNDEYGFNLANIFVNIGEYTIVVKVDEENIINETNKTNNISSYKINVNDFNIDSIYEENDKLRKNIIIAEGKLESCLIQKNDYMQSNILKDNELKTTQTNLNICNQNNSTKIANWVKEMDGNQEAMIQIMQVKYTDLLNEKNNLINQYTAQLTEVENEKTQWSLLVIGGLIGLALWALYGEYMKHKPRKSININ